MKAKRIISGVLMLCLAFGCLCGCQSNTAKKSDTVEVVVGNWPTNNKTSLELAEKRVGIMKEKFPEYTIVPDEWTYDFNTFLTKAASNQLPTVYAVPFTEPRKIIDAGYARDITDIITKNGYKDALDPMYLNILEKDGRYYGLPYSGSLMGLDCNVNLFKEAGLVDENGIPLFPQTYDELAEYAKIIKDKTGKAGFFFPTINNQGGWQFTSIVWSFGGDFVELKDDKWVAIFDSEECVAALQYLKDLKWKYDVLQTNILTDVTEFIKLFAIDDVAMGFDYPVTNMNTAVRNYGMDRSNVAYTKVPAGPVSRSAVLSGNVNMFDPNATDEEVEGALRWLEIKGFTPSVDEEFKKTWDDWYANIDAQGEIVGSDGFSVWSNSDSAKYKAEVRAKYCNVDKRLFETYDSIEGVTIHTEPAACAQDLYKILDAVIQKTLTEKDSDPKALLTEAAAKFQKDYLDKLN